MRAVLLALGLGGSLASLDRPVTKKAGVSSLSGTRPLRSSSSRRSAMNDVHPGR